MAESHLFDEEYENALEWFRKSGEWGAPTRAGEYDTRGEAWVEAARMCVKLGLPEEAATQYERAMREGGGWGAVVAALDRGAQLSKEGRYAEALAVLSSLTDGSKGPVAAGYGHLFAANCYRRRGDLDSARHSAELAIEQTRGITDDVALQQGVAIAAQARDLLASLRHGDVEATDLSRGGSPPGDVRTEKEGRR